MAKPTPPSRKVRCDADIGAERSFGRIACLLHSAPVIAIALSGACDCKCSWLPRAPATGRLSMQLWPAQKFPKDSPHHAIHLRRQPSCRRRPCRQHRKQGRHARRDRTRARRRREARQVQGLGGPAGRRLRGARRQGRARGAGRRGRTGREGSARQSRKGGCRAGREVPDLGRKQHRAGSFGQRSFGPGSGGGAAGPAAARVAVGRIPHHPEGCGEGLPQGGRLGRRARRHR